MPFLFVASAPGKGICMKISIAAEKTKPEADGKPYNP